MDQILLRVLFGMVAFLAVNLVPWGTWVTCTLFRLEAKIDHVTDVNHLAAKIPEPRTKEPSFAMPTIGPSLPHEGRP